MSPECGGFLGDCLISGGEGPEVANSISGGEGREDIAEVSLCHFSSKRLRVDTTTQHPGAMPTSRPSHIQEPSRSVGMIPASSIRVPNTTRGPIHRQHQSMIAHANRIRQKRQGAAGSTGSAPNDPSGGANKNINTTPTTTATTTSRIRGKSPPSPTRVFQRSRSGSLKAQRDDIETRYISTNVRVIQNHSQDTSMAAVRPPAVIGNEETESDETTCDYDKSATVLYELLEASSWEEAKDRSRSHPGEVKTWIIRRDKNHKVRWKLLPLHASIIFQAPHSVVTCLLDIYTLAAQRRDDQGMLPLHLAFRHKQEDEELLEALLRHFPRAVALKDHRDRVPLDHGRDLKFSSKVMKLYAEASVAAKDSEKSPRASFAPAGLRQQPGAAEADLTALRQKQKDELRQLKTHYEEKIAELRERIEDDAKHLKLVAAEEKQLLIERHETELAQLREFLSTQAGRENTMMQDLQAQIDDVQTALEVANRKSERWAERYKAMENYGSELRIQLHRIIQDQILIRDLATRQTNELEASRKMRSQIIQTLVQQEDTDGHNDHMRAAKLLEVTENVRERIQQLLQQDPMDEHMSRPSRIELERGNVTKIIKSSRPADFEQQVDDNLRNSTDIILLDDRAGPDLHDQVEIRPMRSQGDEISAITEHSP